MVDKSSKWRTRECYQILKLLEELEGKPTTAPPTTTAPPPTIEKKERGEEGEQKQPK
jgi:hypothetical protein